jgi:hypothetical protein
MYLRSSQQVSVLTCPTEWLHFPPSTNPIATIIPSCSVADCSPWRAADRTATARLKKNRALQSAWNVTFFIHTWYTQSHKQPHTIARCYWAIELQRRLDSSVGVVIRPQTGGTDPLSSPGWHDVVVKSAWGGTSTPPYVFIMWRLIVTLVQLPLVLASTVILDSDSQRSVAFICRRYRCKIEIKYYFVINSE